MTCCPEPIAGGSSFFSPRDLFDSDRATDPDDTIRDALQTKQTSRGDDNACQEQITICWRWRWLGTKPRKPRSKQSSKRFRPNSGIGVVRKLQQTVPWLQ